MKLTAQQKTNKKMVELYVSDISSLPDPKDCPEQIEKLPEKRRERIGKMRQSKSRKQSLGAGLLLEKVLMRYGLSSKDVYQDENGKPMIEGLYFNLSHSGDIVICAVSNSPVGCDIEQSKKAPAHLAERYFCEGEKQYLSQFAGDEYDREFYRLWTMKESYMKYTGEGTRLALNKFEIQIQDEIRVLRDGVIQPCILKEYDVPGYCVTVCIKDEQ